MQQNHSSLHRWSITVHDRHACACLNVSHGMRLSVREAAHRLAGSNPIDVFLLVLLPSSRRCNKAGGEGDGEDSQAGATDLQAWSALFTEAILIESPRLVDRPTALKLPDGQWRGVVSTTTARESKAIPTFRKTWPLQVPGRCAVCRMLCVK